MLGIFHLLMMYIGILNKRFSDTGLKDALIKSSIIAEGPIDSALRGKCYNRGVRLYETTYESCLRLVLMKVMTLNLFLFYKTLHKNEKFCTAVLTDSSEAVDCISYDLINAV